MAEPWNELAKCYLGSIQDSSCGAARSTTDGPVTLYGTCYSLLAMHYLGEDVHVTSRVRHFVTAAQEATSGLFVGPGSLTLWQVPARCMIVTTCCCT